MFQSVVCALSKDSCLCVFFLRGLVVKCATTLVGGDGDYWPQPTYILLQIWVCDRKVQRSATLCLRKDAAKGGRFKEQTVFVGNSLFHQMSYGII